MRSAALRIVSMLASRESLEPPLPTDKEHQAPTGAHLEGRTVTVSGQVQVQGSFLGWTPLKELVPRVSGCGRSRRKNAGPVRAGHRRAVCLGQRYKWLETMRSYGPRNSLKACWFSQLFPRLRGPLGPALGCQNILGWCSAAPLGDQKT